MALEVIQDTVTLVAGVLDESGSMANVKVETINGYNSFVSKVQEEQAGKEAYVSTFFFDSNGYDPTLRVIQDGIPLSENVPLTTSSYNPRGGTPLYDAIGIAIRNIDKLVEEKGINRVTLLIQTDGYENASKEFTHAQITSLIKDRQDNRQWQIIFLGADLKEAVSMGTSLGVASANSMSYKKGQTATAFDAFYSGTANYRSSTAASAASTLSEAEMESFAVKGDPTLTNNPNLGTSNFGTTMWNLDTNATTTVNVPVGSTTGSLGKEDKSKESSVT